LPVAAAAACVACVVCVVVVVVDVVVVVVFGFLQPLIYRDLFGCRFYVAAVVVGLSTFHVVLLVGPSSAITVMQLPRVTIILMYDFFSPPLLLLLLWLFCCCCCHLIDSL